MKANLKNLYLMYALIAGLGLMLTGRVTAQTFTTLHSFAQYVDGDSLQAGLVLSGNTLYGATEYGGQYDTSTLFAINTDGSGFRTVYNFSAKAPNDLGIVTNSDGDGPDGTLILSGNTLYGTAYGGGANGNGTVFKVTTNGLGFTLLHTFSAGSGSMPQNYINNDGANPESGLILSGNILYGTTEEGGANGFGAMFKVNTDGTGFMNLHSFAGGTNGAVPQGFVLSGNTLYGVASSFYTANATVFKINTDGTGFTNLHNFTTAAGLGLLLAGNTLYGTAGGGTYGNATVFAVNTNGSGFTNLYSFTATSGSHSTNSDGARPVENGGLIISGNTLYGTAFYGGSAGNGTVFSLNTNGTGFTTLHSFNPVAFDGYGDYTNNDGANPYAGLILSGNALYGTAQYGGNLGNGNGGDGTVFSVSLALAVTTTMLPTTTSGETYTQTLAAFGGLKPYSWTNTSGALPPGLTLATDGIISGTPTNNGTFNFTVKVTDAANNTATQTLSVTVVSLQVTTASLPNGTNGLVYSQQLSAVNGQLPYNWSLISGSIPPSMTLTTNGLISGTLTTNGLFNITVKVTDAVSITATQSFALMVGNLPTASIRQVANASNLDLVVSVGGTGPFSYQWQLNGTNLPSGIISTVAGNGVGAGTFNGSYYSGDGGPATNAEISYPHGVTTDTTGNLFIADYDNGVVRKVDVNGIITTVAGGGTNGLGDGGAATNAELNPYDVALDADGNMFIADYGDCLIRKVDKNGIISTVAGGGTNYPGDGETATNAEFYNTSGVAVDAVGNLFIADLWNSRICKVGTNGILTTVAGGGTNYPGDGGTATNAELSGPQGIAMDTAGNLFIADSGNRLIRKVSSNGIISTVAGGGNGDAYWSGVLVLAATNVDLVYPTGVALDAVGNLFIADQGHHVILKVATNGIVNRVAGIEQPYYSGDGGVATDAALNEPAGVAVDTVGNLFIADSLNNRIRKVIILGPTLANVGTAGSYDVVVSSPYGSVTSSVVNVTVTLPIILSAPQVTVGKTNFTFQLSGQAGSNYVLQVSTNLSNWSSVSTSTIPVSGITNVSDPVSNYNRRFYRVHLQ